MERVMTSLLLCTASVSGVLRWVIDIFPSMILKFRSISFRRCSSSARSTTHREFWEYMHTSFILIHIYHIVHTYMDTTSPPYYRTAYPLPTRAEIEADEAKSRKQKNAFVTCMEACRINTILKRSFSLGHAPTSIISHYITSKKKRRASNRWWTTTWYR